ncbi:DUF3888 domain-containing protein [Peribacillus simplex]|uniref:DUF3888 domain-containing protein n=1 Tax=Peribacillus simplex TaxID=1478 RepID=UPI003D27C4C8
MYENKLKLNGTKQYDCTQVKQIKKIDQGSYLFTTDIQVVTFEGPHNPPSYVINITFSNSGLGWEWKAINFKSKLLVVEVNFGLVFIR